MIKAVIFDMFETLITHYQSPLYFAAQISAELGIPEPKFRELWDPADYRRSIGTITLEELIEQILKANNCYSKERVDYVVQKRIEAKIECFNHLHPDILPMMEQLKARGIKIGLISNCFSEEAPVIHDSVLWNYFDAPYLSYEQGLAKPDKELFYRCVERLRVKPEECLYVGDGGSRELETAEELGMKPLQAVWYFTDVVKYPSRRKPEFKQAESPRQILDFLK